MAIPVHGRGAARRGRDGHQPRYRLLAAQNLHGLAGLHFLEHLGEVVLSLSHGDCLHAAQNAAQVVRCQSSPLGGSLGDSDGTPKSKQEEAEATEGILQNEFDLCFLGYLLFQFSSLGERPSQRRELTSSISNTMNILFLFSDEQRCDTLGCYGNERLHMPHLNGLAGRSVVFEDPHCTQPVCTPSRGSLMTGLLPHAHGATGNNIPLPGNVSCLPELLPDNLRSTYRTGYVGKWHLGDEIFAQHGFEQWTSIEDMYIPHYSAGRDRSLRSDYHHYLDEQGFTSGPRGIYDRAFAARLAEPYTKAHFVGTETTRFIREHRGQSWLCVASFLEPHMPFFGPRDRQYPPGSIPLPDNYDAVPDESQPEFLRRIHATYRENGFEDQALKSDADWRQLIARYWGLNSMVDTQVGRVLAALEETGQADDTLVVYTSDHGDQMGSHQLLGKEVMFRESTRVPLLIHLPGQKEQGRVQGPVSHIDLAPTLLDFLGAADVTPALHGRSLLPVCREAAEGRRVSALDTASPCVIEWNPGGSKCPTTVRTLITPENERYSHYEDGSHEYYDLASDASERRNLATDPGRQDRIQNLREQLARWQKEVGDTAEPIR